jgi:transmembrane sensor
LRQNDPMIDPTGDNGRRLARDEALVRFVRMNSGDATVSDCADLESWLQRDPRNRQEFERLAGVWADLEALPDPRHARAAAGLSRRRLLRGTVALTGLAAGIGVLVAGGLPEAVAADLRTGTGERRTASLADGSQVELDAGSALAVDFTPQLRRLRLLSGRALFTVAADPDRPFEVACAGGAVRALGTVFVVHRRAVDVAVSVAESAVSVAMPAVAPTMPAVRLAAGQRLVYGPSGIGPVALASTAIETAWRRGKLAFEDRPLGDVVVDLNRYRRGRIVIWDQALIDLRVDGIFDTADPDAALDGIVRTLPVQILHVSSYLAVLRSTGAG